jgi:asparagine synthase (glutamine-hydrolysing)
MCGILGSINIPVDESLLDTIKHRGPDDFGIERYNLGQNQITLAHRRLAIVDLSPAGHQPMSSACGNLVMIFNGEIYNHQDLRARLGHIQFRGHSDSETIVNYIAKFGIESVAEFNGIFAFAIYDKLKQKLYLVRDRFGVKPLYYYHEQDQLIFSSEIRPLQRRVSPQLDLDNLALNLRLRYTPSPYTLFNNIYKLRPGHYAEYDIVDHTFTLKSYIRPVSLDPSISFDDAVEQYGILFENAVKRQLMSDVDVGMWLSGGVDSALVTHFAVKHYSGTLKTFTVGFSEKSEADETEAARNIAHLLGTEHHEVMINENEFGDVFRKVLNIVEEPLGTTSTIPLYFLNQLVSKHVKVALSGQGADEPLGGYSRYQGELYRDIIPGPLWKLGQSVGQRVFSHNEKVTRSFYALGEADVVSRFDKTYALFTESEINRLIGRGSRRSVESIQYYYSLLEGASRHPVEAMMANDLRMNLSDDLLLYADKIAMHYSVEGRVPLLDHELVQFAESLPYSYRLGFGKGKVIHKKFAERLLPKDVIYQKKKGFKSPTEKWFKEMIGSTFEELLTSRSSRFSHHFDVDEVRKNFQKHRQNINRDKQLFTLISLYYWLEQFD